MKSSVFEFLHYFTSILANSWGKRRMSCKTTRQSATCLSARWEDCPKALCIGDGRGSFLLVDAKFRELVVVGSVWVVVSVILMARAEFSRSGIGNN